MSKYSVEEVRAAAIRRHSHVADMLNDYAERIEADERVVPAAGTPERQLFDLAHAWGANKIHNYQLMHHIEQIVKKLRTAALRDRLDLAESRLAAANALLRRAVAPVPWGECDGLLPDIQAHLQGAGDE